MSLMELQILPVFIFIKEEVGSLFSISGILTKSHNPLIKQLPVLSSIPRVLLIVPRIFPKGLTIRAKTAEIPMLSVAESVASAVVMGSIPRDVMAVAARPKK